MNQSSLYSYDDSSIWDPKVIRQHLFIPEDELNILCTIPEWTKAPNNLNTSRIEKDSTLGNSQFQDSIGILQNSKKIRQNIELFDKYLEDRRIILRTNKIYKGKFTRSASLFDLNETSENLHYSNSLKRTFSSPAVCHSSNISHVKHQEKEPGSEKYSEKNSPNKEELPICRSVDYSAVADKATSEPEITEDLFTINSEVMEVVSRLTRSISTHVESIPEKELNFEATEEKENMLSSQHTSLGKGNTVEQILPFGDKSVKNDNDSLTITKAGISIITPCENNEIDTSNLKETGAVVAISDAVTENDKMSLNDEVNQEAPISKNDNDSFTITKAGISIITPCENNEIDASNLKETVAVVAISDAVNENDKMSLNDEEKQEVPISIKCESNNSELYTVKEIILVDVGSAVNGNVEVHWNIQEVSEVNKTPKKSSELLEVPSKEQTFSSKNLGSDNKLSNENSSISNDEKIDGSENIQKVCHKEISLIANDSPTLKTAVSEKRKLESKNKRTKKRRSEENQGTVKIRSVKKVGEVHYCVSDVKTMLDIMKHFL